MLNLVKKHEQKNTCTLLPSMQKNIYIRLTLALTTFLKILHLSVEKAKQIKTQTKAKNINELKEGSKDKPLHGKYC